MNLSYQSNPSGYLAFANMKYDLIKMGKEDALAGAVFDAMVQALGTSTITLQDLDNYDLFSNQESEFDK